MFRVSCLGIWWRHDIWISEKLKFDYFKNEKSFQNGIKNFFLVSKELPFRSTKQTGKNVADTTFKINFWFDCFVGTRPSDSKPFVFYGLFLKELILKSIMKALKLFQTCSNFTLNWFCLLKMLRQNIIFFPELFNHWVNIYWKTVLNTIEDSLL